MSNKPISTLKSPVKSSLLSQGETVSPKKKTPMVLSGPNSSSHYNRQNVDTNQSAESSLVVKMIET